jgi:hypothetical protein
LAGVFAIDGASRWAKRPWADTGDYSLRGLIAFSVEPEPSATEVEDIIRKRTIRVQGGTQALKLHYSKFEDFIRLNKQERSVVRRLMDVDQYAKPIYPWQGEMAILGEEWAGCLGVTDTRQFFYASRSIVEAEPQKCDGFLTLRALNSESRKVRPTASETSEFLAIS